MLVHGGLGRDVFGGLVVCVQVVCVFLVAIKLQDVTNKLSCCVSFA